MLQALHITNPILDVIIAAFLVYISYYDVKYLKIKNKVLLMLLPFTAARGAAAAALEILENGSGKRTETTMVGTDRTAVYRMVRTVVWEDGG